MKTINFKKLVLSATCVILCVALLLSVLPVAFAVADECKPVTNTQTVAGEDSENVYVAENFSQLTSDWEQIAASDVANTKLSFHNGEMSVFHKGTSGSPANYFGSAYKIATNKTYTDFTFEMTFRMNYWENDSRFVAVMFHTRESNGRLMGYMANYRVNGENAVTCLTENSVDDAKNTNSIVLSDKNLHTLKLEMSGNIVRYFIDDSPIAIAVSQRPAEERAYEWDTTTIDDGNFASHLDNGGFALLVNRSMCAIKSVTIKPYAESSFHGDATENAQDNNVVNTYYDMYGNVTNGPTVVCDVKDAITLDSLNGAVRPSNAILNFSNGNVVDANGNTLGTFDEVYQKIRGKVIPVVRVETQADADAFADYMNNTLNILDISVLSSTPALVKRVRTKCPNIRGMIYFDDVSSLWDVVATTHANLATVVVLPQRLCTLENVTYIQARFETVWAVADSYLSADIYQCVNSGAYGVVSPYFRDVYDVLTTYSENSITRTPMNVAHRGCSNLAYENSLSAVRLAIEKGATHLELDGILTKDGKIAISHDDSIVAITNGSGSISNMTLAEVQRFDLTLRDTASVKDAYLYVNGTPIKEHIPSLDEVLTAIKGTGVILVFEIKTDDVAIVSALKRAIEAHDVADQVVVICFDGTGQILSAMAKQLPETPVALLQGLAGGGAWSAETIDVILKDLCSRNAALDKSYTHGGASTQLNRYLRDRGMVGWYWTFADENALDLGEKLGFFGLTNDCAELYQNRVRFVVGGENSLYSLSVGDKVSVKTVTYGGVETVVQAEVTYCKRSANGWKVVARYQTEKGYYLYTQVFEVTKAD